jgi:hypothetical protein
MNIDHSERYGDSVEIENIIRNQNIKYAIREVLGSVLIGMITAIFVWLVFAI